METRYLGENLPIVIQFISSPLTIYEKDYDDITEVSMNFKKNTATDDDDAYLERKETTSGVVVDSVNHKFTMLMDDYQKVIAGDYHLVLGITLDGITDMIEPEISDDLIRITTDKQRA